MQLRRVVAALERIAPPELAEPWDNVGLLVAPRRAPEVRRILLAIDLTLPVVAESVQRRCELVVAYHPPLFDPLRSLAPGAPRVDVLLAALEARLAIWSPHTALDAVDGGVNDWLAEALGPGQREPLQVRATDVAGTGLGRRVVLARSAPLGAVAARVQRWLRVRHLQVGAAGRHPVRTAAVCAGAGGSVVAGADADLVLTGELRHHDVLDFVARGVHVILAGHSHTERGYLLRLRRRLSAELGAGTAVWISRADRDPLRVR